MGAWATVGNTTQNNVIQGSDWATVNASGQIVAYTGYTPYTSGTLNGSVSAATNLQVVQGATAAVVPTDTDSANRTTDINTIAFKNTANVVGTNLYIGNGNTLRLGKVGGIARKTSRPTGP